MATCKWEGCEDEMTRGGSAPSHVKLSGSGSNICSLWLGWSWMGMEMGVDFGNVGGGGGCQTGSSCMERGAAKCCGGRGGLNK